VETYARCGGTFNKPLYCKFTAESYSEKIENRLKFDRTIAMSLWPYFFGPPCIRVHRVRGVGGGICNVLSHASGARFTKYLTIYRKIIIRSTYDSDLQCAEISLRDDIVS